MSLFNKKNEEKTEEIETIYSCVVECENCGNEEEYEFAFGTSVDKNLKGKLCEVCGCLILGEDDLDEDDIEAAKKIIAEEEEANQEEVIEDAKETREELPKINLPRL